MKFPNRHFLAYGVLRPLESDGVTHKLSMIGKQYQILCKPARGMQRVRNVNFLYNSSNWGDVTCQECLKQKA